MNWLRTTRQRHVYVSNQEYLALESCTLPQVDVLDIFYLLTDHLGQNYNAPLTLMKTFVKVANVRIQNDAF